MISMFANLKAKLKLLLVGYVTPRCVGVDISSTAIKMVELLPNSLIIANYRIKPLANNLVVAGIINDLDQLAEIMAQEWLDFKANYRNVALALPSAAIVLREMNAPLFQHQHHLDDYLRQQLINQLPNQDIDFDYQIKQINQQTQDLAVVVAKKATIEEYQALMQLSGMHLAAIDIESFAIQHLFEALLLKNTNPSQQIILFDLGATRLRAFVFLNHKQIIFHEISVQHSIPLADGISPREHQPILPELVKLLQQLRSVMLIEKKIALAENSLIYLHGGNSLLPKVKDYLMQQNFKQLFWLSDLFASENKHVPASDLMRLLTAIALATWGQQIGAN